MTNRYPDVLAKQALEACLQHKPPEINQLLELALSEQWEEEASQSLFQGLIAPLADRFDSLLCDAYVTLFSRVVSRLYPEWQPSELVRRYEQASQFRRFDPGEGSPAVVYVLSRVTLGADVAITSIVLDAMKKRFPKADIYFVGPYKNWELFAADNRIKHLPIEYPRNGTLHQRLAISRSLQTKLNPYGSIVVDPDSRLTQLGLVPVCPIQNYYFFESRTYGGNGDESLQQLTQRWVADTFGITDAKPYIAPTSGSNQFYYPHITVSFGVGNNPAKRVSDSFEKEVLGGLLRLNLPLVIDLGDSEEEAQRVHKAAESFESLKSRIQFHQGSIGDLAECIRTSRLYVGYDSAGQHIASVLNVPLVAIFNGSPCERFFHRWKPTNSENAVVIRADKLNPQTALKLTIHAIWQLLVGNKIDNHLKENM